MSVNDSSGRVRGRTAGFTLIEVLVVLAIIMSLVGIVSLNVIHHQARAKVDTTKMKIHTLREAVKHYELDHGRPPTMDQGLQALVRKPTVEPLPDESKYPDGGYIEGGKLPLDGWKHEFIYVVPGAGGQHFEIISYGRDGQPGGEKDAADISSSNLSD